MLGEIRAYLGHPQSQKVTFGNSCQSWREYNIVARHSVLPQKNNDKKINYVLLVHRYIIYSIILLTSTILVAHDVFKCGRSVNKPSVSWLRRRLNSRCLLLLYLVLVLATAVDIHTSVQVVLVLVPGTRTSTPIYSYIGTLTRVTFRLWTTYT